MTKKIMTLEEDKQESFVLAEKIAPLLQEYIETNRGVVIAGAFATLITALAGGIAGDASRRKAFINHIFELITTMHNNVEQEKKSRAKHKKEH